MRSKPSKNGGDPPENRAAADIRQQILLYITPVLAGVAAIFGLFVLAEWIFGYFRRNSETITYVPMAPLTATLFLLATTSAFLQSRWAHGQKASAYARIASTAVIFVSLLVLAQFLKLLPTDIENIFTAAAVSSNGSITGRVSPITSGLFILISVSAIISSLHSKSRIQIMLADGLSLAALVAAFTIVIAYWYQSPLFYGGTTIPVAFLTGVSFLLVSAAQLFSRRESLLYRFMISQSVAAQICRAVIPVFILGKLLMNVIQARLNDMGLRPSPATDVGLTIIVLTFIVVVVVIVSRYIDRRIAVNESALQKSEEKYRTLVDNSLVGVYRSNFDGDFIYANEAAVKMFGFDSADELILEGVASRYKNRADRETLLDGLKEHGKVGGLELEMLTKTGGTRTILLSATLDGDTISGMVADITERKRAEETFRSIFDASVDGILLADPETRKIYLGNRAICQMLGYTKDEISSMDVTDIHYQEDIPSILKDFEAQSKGLVKLSQDVRLKKKDGSSAYADIKSSQVKIAGRNYLAGVFRDATERRSAEDALTESERLYRSLFENMLNGFAYCKMLFKDGKPVDFIYLSVNTAFENLTGMRNVLGRKVSEVIPGIQEDNPEVFEIYGRVAATGKPERFETFVVGLGMWFSISVYSPAREYFVAVFDVITERKKAEEALKESERRYRTALDSLMEGCQIIGFNWRYLYVNDSAASQSQRSRDGLLGKTMMEIYPDIEKTEMFRHLNDCMERRISQRIENLFTFPNGSQGYFDLTIQPVPEGIFILSLDITERKRAEEAVRISGENFRNTLESQALGCRIYDGRGTVLYANPAVARLYGYDSVEELNRVPYEQTLTPKSLRENQERIANALAGGGLPQQYEAEIVRRDGQIRHLAAFTNTVIWGGKKRTHITYQDITERKLAEEKIRNAAEEWKTTFDSIPDAISIHSADFTLTRVNKAFTELFGMKTEDVLGRKCYELMHGTDEPISLCPFKKTVATAQSARLETMEPHLGRYLDITTSPIFNDRKEVIGCVHITRDITEQKKMQEQLMLTDRLASIGLLASGIAHEMNNPLTSVIGYSELILAHELPEEIRDDLNIVNREAQRTAQVVRGLLMFARKQGTDKGLVDINSVIEGVLGLRAYEHKVSNITIRRLFASGLPQIPGNIAQLQQVFINLIVNAEQAMLEAHGKGTLTIATEQSASGIRISFADDGPGITQENMRRLFTPFFTTKEVGKGTGLGLSICHGIVTEHGGQIYAESQSGNGTTFIVELPLAKKAENEGKV